MERSRAQLVVRSVVVRASQLKEKLPTVPPSRGSSVVPLIHFICDSIATRAERFGAQILTAPAEDVASYFRMLQQLLKVEVSLHDYVSKYRSEIDRHDLPVGLLYLVDSIALDLLGSEFDPLIHTDSKRNYSTDSLLHDLQPLIKQCDGSYSETTKPIIFNVPALDPANAFLAPILVHEAAHTYLRTSTLVSEIQTAMPDKVQQLAEKYKKDTGSTWPHRIFDNWVAELLCDCIALLMTGPSFPLALSSLAASFDAVPRSDTHPYMLDRVAIMWRHMVVLGWDNLFAENLPTVAEWFHSMSYEDSDEANPEAILRQQAMAVGEVLLDICGPHVRHKLEHDRFHATSEVIQSSIRDKVPPAEVNGEAPSPWSVVLSGWLVALEDVADPLDLATVVGDDDLSRFLVKTMELAAIVELWRNEHSRS